jgi:hypothetical protein
VGVETRIAGPGAGAGWAAGAGAEAGVALLRSIGARFTDFGGLYRVHEIRSRSWASVTFNGARHEFEFSLQGPGAGAAADAFLSARDESGFELRGHILADLTLVRDTRPWPGGVWLRFEALTVEDC